MPLSARLVTELAWEVTVTLVAVVLRGNFKEVASHLSLKERLHISTVG